MQMVVRYERNILGTWLRGETQARSLNTIASIETATGLSRRAVTTALKGTRDPDLSTLSKLDDKTGIPLAESIPRAFAQSLFNDLPTFGDIDLYRTLEIVTDILPKFLGKVLKPNFIARRLRALHQKSDSKELIVNNLVTMLGSVDSTLRFYLWGKESPDPDDFLDTKMAERFKSDLEMTDEDCLAEAIADKIALEYGDEPAILLSAIGQILNTGIPTVTEKSNPVVQFFDVLKKRLGSAGYPLTTSQLLAEINRLGIPVTKRVLYQACAGESYLGEESRYHLGKFLIQSRLEPMISDLEIASCRTKIEAKYGRNWSVFTSALLRLQALPTKVDWKGNEIGELMKEILWNTGLSHAELGKALGFSSEQIKSFVNRDAPTDQDASKFINGTSRNRRVSKEDVAARFVIRKAKGYARSVSLQWNEMFPRVRQHIPRGYDGGKVITPVTSAREGRVNAYGDEINRLAIANAQWPLEVSSWDGAGRDVGITGELMYKVSHGPCNFQELAKKASRINSAASARWGGDELHLTWLLCIDRVADVERKRDLVTKKEYRKVKYISNEHEGYDLLVSDRYGTPIERIEVKGSLEIPTTLDFTDEEYNVARQAHDRGERDYFLIGIFNAFSREPIVMKVCDPIQVFGITRMERWCIRIGRIMEVLDVRIPGWRRGGVLPTLY